MRKSRVLLAGVAVAAAAAGTSAFTTSNDFTGVDNNVAGYGELEVSGAKIVNIAYTPDADVSKLASVTFTAGEQINGAVATMGLTFEGDPVALSDNDCVVGAWDAVEAEQFIVCTLDAPVLFEGFDKLGLTVVSQ
jgi:hypothetical protein